MSDVIGLVEDVREIAIFRHNLFRLSEPFIAQQAQHLRRYRPLYLGRWRFGQPPGGTESLALQDLARWRALPCIAWQMTPRAPAPYHLCLKSHLPPLSPPHFVIKAFSALPLPSG